MDMIGNVAKSLLDKNGSSGKNANLPQQQQSGQSQIMHTVTDKITGKTHPNDAPGYGQSSGYQQGYSRPQDGTSGHQQNGYIGGEQGYRAGYEQQGHGSRDQGYSGGHEQQVYGAGGYQQQGHGGGYEQQGHGPGGYQQQSHGGGYEQQGHGPGGYQQQGHGPGGYQQQSHGGAY